MINAILVMSSKDPEVRTIYTNKCYRVGEAYKHFSTGLKYRILSIVRVR